VTALAGFVLAFLATARVTRFFTSDVLAEPMRQWVASRWGEESRTAYLLTCPWCASIWVAPVPVAVLVWWWGGAPWFAAVAAWLGVSYLYGLAASRLDLE
jgi:hypothetical protein